MIFAILALSAGTYSLFQSMMVPALPRIEGDLGVSAQSTTWLITAYLISASVATPVAGNLGDLFGKRRVLIAVLLACGLGTIIGGFANSIELLILARTLQGIAGAVFPLSFGIIRDEFPARWVPAGIAMISSILGIGGIFGITLAGPIVEHLSYHWLFWFPLVIVAAAVIGAATIIPDDPTRKRADPLDWRGAVLLSAWLTVLLLAISQGAVWGWGSPGQLLMGLASVAIFLVWLRTQLRSRAPMVDMRMMSHRTVWTTNLAGTCYGYCLFASLVLVPQLVEAPTSTGYGLGASVTEAGLYLLPSTAAMIAMGPLAGWIAGNRGPRVAMMIGGGFSAVAFAGLAFAHDQAWHIYVTSLLTGIGNGLAYSSLPNLIVSAVPREQTGTATGINVVARNIGGAVGSQVSIAIVGATGAQLASSSDYTVAFLVAMVMPLISVLVLAGAPKRRGGTPTPRSRPEFSSAPL